MSDVAEVLQHQVAELEQLIDGLDNDALAAESACPGWSIADVLIHLAQTNQAATASVNGNFGDLTSEWLGSESSDNTTVDADVAAAVAAAADTTGAEAATWWKQSADEMVAAFAAADPASRVQWVAGDMAARTLCTTRIAETWIHTTDIAHGLGVQVTPTDRLWHIARLVHRTIPYSFMRDNEPAPGAVRFELTAPDGSDWVFGSDDAPTVITGSAYELCMVAGQRGDAADTSLSSSGPDGPGVLRLMRTFA